MSEQETVIVCSRIGYFDDDVHGECADCGADIVWRPHVTEPSTKLCMPCVLDRADGQPIEIGVSEQTREEVKRFYDRRRH